jgi:DNA integrity scanning protein DisA with diadenylate cyclase activity
MSNITNQYVLLGDLVRQLFAKVTWSHKIQEKQADLHTNYHRFLKWLEIIVISLTSVGIVSLIFTNCMAVTLVSALLSFLAVSITIIFKSFDFMTIISQHKTTANNLWLIREQLEVLLVGINTQEKYYKECLNDYELLLEKLNRIYENAPNTTDQAVKLASKSLKVKKDNSFDDEGIDSWLPSSLRKGGHDDVTV